MILARHVRRYALIAVLVAVAAPPSVWAQSGKPVAAQDLEAADALERPARLTVRDVQLPYALTKLYERSGVPVSFSPSLLPRITVSCACDTLTVARALEHMLSDSGLKYREIDGHVLVYRPSNLDAMPSLQSTQTRYASRTVPELTRGLAATTGTRLRLPSEGTLAGTVAEAGTGKPIVNAQIAVDGAGRAFTDEEGRYRITNVPVGRRSISVTSIGYKRASREVEVHDGTEVTVDFELEISPSQLDAVVVTVTGEQRRRELGHVVGRINADSVVRESPVSSMSELLNARVPGLQVFETQGSVGGDASIRIRGVTTFLLDQEPIVIVDGVRYYSGRISVAGGPGQFNSGTEPSFRLNDLNPNEIESIEVVKGPSAATLYGTDAVNGVIVITTKRGQSGPARWNAYARYSVSEVPTGRFPDLYRGVSSTVDNCTRPMVARGQCVQDGIERFPNPMAQSDYTLFAAAPSWMQGLSVSGGAAGIRYHVSADYEDATGPVQMPPVFAERAKAARGVDRLPKNQIRPNQMTKLNLRSNLSLALRDAIDLQGSVGFSRNTTSALNFVYGPYQTALVSNTSTPEDPFGTGFNQPDEAFARSSTELLNRVTGALRLEVRPRPWWTSWGAIGVDLANSDRTNLALPGEGSPVGLVSDMRRKNMLTTADLGSAASWVLHPAFSARTAVGAQYVRSFNDGLVASGTNLSPGGRTVASAATQTLAVNHDETVTLGGYVEQTIGYRDRLFVSGALRADGGSAFGRDYQAVVYPKVHASWIVSDESFMARVPGLDDFRIRYAYGGSGRQPTSAMALPTFQRENRRVYGSVESLISQSGLGNPDLRPERTMEHEYGFDAGVFHDRIRIEATWYRRTTIDGIRSMALPTGFGSRHVNVGEVHDKGIETQLIVRPVDRPQLNWDITLQHSRNTNRVLRLGDAPPVYSGSGGVVEGYPIGARFLRPYLGYEDANGDGVIEQHEVLIGDTPVFLGVASPPVSQTLHTVVGLFAQRLRLSALLDRRAGHTLQDDRFYGECSSGYCRALVDPSAPLDLQALAVAPRLQFSIVSKADLVRLREVGVMAAIPSSLTSKVGVRDASISVQARNLALWTSYRAVDPESSSLSSSMSTNGSRGGSTGIPQPRSWVLRIDIGF